jgi:single-stranded DNA-binding protein
MINRVCISRQIKLRDPKTLWKNQVAVANFHSSSKIETFQEQKNGEQESRTFFNIVAFRKTSRECKTIIYLKVVLVWYRWVDLQSRSL